MSDKFDSYDGEEEEGDGYTEQERGWLYNYSAFDIVKLLHDESRRRAPGDNFTLPELLEGTWEYFNEHTARQAGKDFKIKVIQKVITTVYFLSNEKRNGCYIYIRR